MFDRIEFLGPINHRHKQIEKFAVMAIDPESRTPVLVFNREGQPYLPHEAADLRISWVEAAKQAYILASAWLKANKSEANDRLVLTCLRYQAVRQVIIAEEDVFPVPAPMPVIDLSPEDFQITEIKDTKDEQTSVESNSAYGGTAGRVDPQCGQEWQTGAGVATIHTAETDQTGEGLAGGHQGGKS